ncbi:MAG: CocE/NonD family hydrolase [Oscillospiraceae bacterium]|nr:CocE/NonD family hydrolase [Oscillospiraceae bacterium]
MIEYTRVSRYYPGCDGTKLAVDLYLPVTERRVPVLVECGYEDRRRSFESRKPALERFLEAGYALAFIEPRGFGASYGVSEGFFSPRDAEDLASIVDAITLEPWCSGKAGSFGGSNKGQSQQLMLTRQPKRLFAAAPCDCNPDFYYQNFTNGASSLPRRPGHHASAEEIGTPVDEDPAPEYPLAHEALACHRMNLGFLEQHVPNMFRDQVNPRIGYAPNLEIPAWSYMDRIRHGHVKVYQNAAWFDPGCTGEIFGWKSWGGKLLLGPWRHCEIYRGGSDLPAGGFDWVAEHIRFFDPILKGQDNGSQDEPPILYYTQGAKEGEEWRYAADLPLDTQTQPDLYLTPEGGLTEEEAPSGKRDYTVRNDLTLYPGFGKLDRRITADMGEFEGKSLCFTLPPLEKDLELTGIPVLNLWVTSTHTDGNFIAALDEVLPDGSSRFITEGAMRASHAKMHPGTIRDAFGVPYHRGFAADAVSLSPDKPTLLAFNLEAVSRIVKKGSRLRIALSCGGSGYDQPEGFPAEMPTVTVHTGGPYASFLRLPVIAPNVTKFTGTLTLNGRPENASVYAFKRSIYIERGGRRWRKFDCLQVCPEGDQLRFVTRAFTAVRRPIAGGMALTIAVPGLAFTGSGRLPDTGTLGETTWEIKRCMPGFPGPRLPKTTYRNLYVATVPVSKEAPGSSNPQPRHTLDLLVDVILPETGKAPYPCCVYIHGFGGSNHDFEATAPDFLERGVAVASIDYRLPPPTPWPACGWDAKACIRYLKVHAAELGLDPARFAVLGGSMGGHLTSMIAACNGSREDEGEIGGCLEADSSVRAACASFPFTDFFGMGDDCAAVWPLQADRVARCDGPYAPLASMLDYVGPGKGMADVKLHLHDPDPKYVALREKARDASPVCHVSAKSAPTALVHGIFECGIQVPMGQSLRFFEALTRAGVKSLLLCNNNGIYGADPEVKQAVVDFIVSRI